MSFWARLQNRFRTVDKSRIEPVKSGGGEEHITSRSGPFGSVVCDIGDAVADVCISERR